MFKGPLLITTTSDNTQAACCLSCGWGVVATAGKDERISVEKILKLMRTPFKCACKEGE